MTDSRPRSPSAVLLPGTMHPDTARALADGARAATGPEHADIDAALRLAPRAAEALAFSPGTADEWSAMASLAAVDLAVARTVEPHLDALGILAEAELDPVPRAVYGVFAAEGAGLRLDADEEGRLTGTKPWCSLAGRVDRALVTAHTAAGRRLFDVDLRAAGVRPRQGAWAARGLVDVPSGPVDFDAVAASPVGEDGWYLDRDGFAVGGMRVAACWFGGAVAIAAALHAAAAQREPDQIALAHIGAVDAALHAAATALGDAAARVDSGRAIGRDGALLAARVRAIVARTAEEVLGRVGHALGPAPLALDATHARRVADLTLSIRQHHAERDDAALGRAALTAAPLGHDALGAAPLGLGAVAAW